ncbi:hypothetical protein ABPG74_011595 [Tetrahymena malaccensis]
MKQKLLNICLQWSQNVRSELLIDLGQGKVIKCTSTNKLTNKADQTFLSFTAASQIIKLVKNKQIIGDRIQFQSPQRDFYISNDMKCIKKCDEITLLGGGCVSTKTDSSQQIKQNGQNILYSQKRLTEVTHLEEICTTEDLIIELTKERVIDIDGEIIPYFENFLQMQKLDLASCKILLKVFMYCLEFLLLDQRLSSLQFSSMKPQTAEKFKKYIKRFQQYLKSNMNKFPLYTHLHVLEWINLILKFTNKEKELLASTCTDSDCLIFQLKLEDSQTTQSNQQQQQQIYPSGDSEEAGELIDNFSNLLSQKNQIFHLIAYRKIVQQNFALCAGNLPTYLDQIIFAHHKSFNKFKSQLSFDARMYSLLSINLLLSSFKDIAKSVDFSQNNAVYLNTFLFGKNEGLLSICEDEFKLSQNQHSSNESAKTFMVHHESFRFISSEILKNTYQILNKYLPQTSYYQQQQQSLSNLIQQRQSQEKSPHVQIVFSSSNHSASPTTHFVKINK